MSTFSDFYDMAQDMLSDPDICSTAKLIVTEPGVGDPSKPWEQPGAVKTNYDVTCFYYKPKNNMVNGTVIATGQKAVLVQTEVPKASLLLATWVDSDLKEWQIKTSEDIALNDKVIVYKLLIGT